MCAFSAQLAEVIVFAGQKLCVSVLIGTANITATHTHL